MCLHREIGTGNDKHGKYNFTFLLNTIFSPFLSIRDKSVNIDWKNIKENKKQKDVHLQRNN